MSVKIATLRGMSMKGGEWNAERRTQNTERRKRITGPSFVVKGLGLFVVGNKKTALLVRDIAVSSFFIRANTARMGGVKSLTKKQMEFINKFGA